MGVLDRIKCVQRIGWLSLIFALVACDQVPQEPLSQEDPIASEVTWDQLAGWKEDETQEAWSALLQNCKRMVKEEAIWQHVCTKAISAPIINKNTTKKFFQNHFKIEPLIKSDGDNQGLMTGYYEPLLLGSYQPSERFKYPIYKTPEDMLIIELGDLYPELKGKRVRGKLDGNRVIPFDARNSIDSVNTPLAGQELLWVDDYIDLFFLHIQGSGRVQLPDGKVIGVGYANQNGHPYVSIGKYLIDQGFAKPQGMSMFTLKDWLRNNPDKAEQVLFANPSYVFFHIRDDVESGAVGSLNVPLTPERSIAIDPKTVPLGTALWLDSQYPDGTPLRKLVFAQDTGGAIKGELRADFFFGTGKQAEKWAGTMKQKVRFYRLVPQRIENQH